MAKDLQLSLLYSWRGKSSRSIVAEPMEAEEFEDAMALVTRMNAQMGCYAWAEASDGLMPPTTRESRATRLRGGGCGGSKPVAPEVFVQPQPEAAEAPSEAVAPRSPLSAEQLAKAVERYSTPTVLRTLLTHDPARGGVPIRLVRARWLLTARP